MTGSHLPYNPGQNNEWSKLYGRQITEEEYREIRDNLTEFFEMLYAWEKEEKMKMPLEGSCHE